MLQRMRIRKIDELWTFCRTTQQQRNGTKRRGCGFFLIFFESSSHLLCSAFLFLSFVFGPVIFLSVYPAASPSRRSVCCAGYVAVVRIVWGEQAQERPHNIGYSWQNQQQQLLHLQQYFCGFVTISVYTIAGPGPLPLPFWQLNCFSFQYDTFCSRPPRCSARDNGRSFVYM